MTKYLFYDTETSGFLKGDASKLPPFEQPWIVQMGILLADEEFDYHRMAILIEPMSRKIDPGAEKVHGISVDKAQSGIPELVAGTILSRMLYEADVIVCHNTGFDIPITALMFRRLGLETDALKIESMNSICTMKSTTNYCKLPAKWGYKWPKLEELHQKLFGFGLEGAHDALVDVEYTRKCFFELKQRNII